MSKKQRKTKLILTALGRSGKIQNISFLKYFRYEMPSQNHFKIMFYLLEILNEPTINTCKIVNTS